MNIKDKLKAFVAILTELKEDVHVITRGMGDT